MAPFLELTLSKIENTDKVQVYTITSNGIIGKLKPIKEGFTFIGSSNSSNSKKNDKATNLNSDNIDITLPPSEEMEEVYFYIRFDQSKIIVRSKSILLKEFN